MSDNSTGQVVAEAAEVYENFFVPALFAQWTDPVLEAADVKLGERVLDVACGTGVLARAALARVGTAGFVTGVDINDAMLSVARRLDGRVAWRKAKAEQLPFAAEEFDRTVCQFGLMFFGDQPRALSEMARVTRPGGRIAAAVWASLDQNAVYRALADLVGGLFGESSAEALRAPFALGQPASLVELLRPVCSGVTAEVVPGVATFDSLSSWLLTEIRGWTLADEVDDEGLRELEDAARAEFGPLMADDGRIQFRVAAVVGAGDVAAA